MKKLLVILLAAVLLLAGCGKPGTGDGAGETAYEPVPAVPEEPEYEPAEEMAPPLEESLCGDWYASWEGLKLILTLGEDGGYTFVFPGREDRTGTWAVTDGLVALDGSEGDLFPAGEGLRWIDEGLAFTRTEPETYTPGAVVTGLSAGGFDGYWKSHFVAVGDGAVLSSAVGETTDVYIEGLRVALGGPLFGDVIVDMELKNDMLVYENGDVTVTLALQEDGFLRLTMEAGEPVTVYLASAPVPGTEVPARTD